MKSCHYLQEHSVLPHQAGRRQDHRRGRAMQQVQRRGTIHPLRPGAVRWLCKLGIYSSSLWWKVLPEVPQSCHICLRAFSGAYDICLCSIPNGGKVVSLAYISNNIYIMRVMINND